MKHVPINRAHEHTNHLRETDGEAEQFLLGCLDSLGILIPLVATPVANETFRIVGGVHRYAAACKLGCNELACWIVGPLSDGEFELMRFDLNTRQALDQG